MFTLLPSIEFLGQFYVVPAGIRKRIMNSLAKLILPKTTCMAHDTIFAPRALGGPPIRIRDPWISSHAAVTRNLGPLYAKWFGVPFHVKPDWHALDPFRQIWNVCENYPGVMWRAIGYLKDNGNGLVDQKKVYKEILDIDDAEELNVRRNRVRDKIDNLLIVDGKMSVEEINDVRRFGHWEKENERIARSGRFSYVGWRAQIFIASGGATGSAIRRRKVAERYKIPRVVRKKGEDVTSFAKRYAKKEAYIDSIIRKEKEEEEKSCGKRINCKEDFDDLRKESIIKASMDCICSMCGGMDDSLRHCFEECKVVGEAIKLIKKHINGKGNEGDDESDQNMRGIPITQMLGILPTPELSTEIKWCMASAIYDVKNGIRWRKIKQEDGPKAILNEFKKLWTKDVDMTPQVTRDTRKREERKTNRIKRWEDECSKETEPDLDRVRILFTDGSRLNGNGMSKNKNKGYKSYNNRYYAGYAAISMDGLVEIKQPLFGHIQSNMRAEFKAIIEGLRRIKETDCGVKKILVYSDCLGVVHACNGGIEKRILKGWGKT
jgi:ribonuclease HI